MSETRSRGDVARERILEAALEHFAADGFAATSVQRVADTAGMSKQALMHHFHSKDALREALLENVAAHFKDQLPALVSGLEPGRSDAYLDLIDRFASFFEQQASETRFVVREFLDRPQELTAWLQAHAGPWLSIISDLVERRRAEGEVPADFDATAHLAVVATLLLGTSALVPSPTRGEATSEWRSRMGQAARRLIVVGSGIIDFDGDRRLA